VSIRIPIALVATALVTMACADSPQYVAERFWTAAQQHDEETVRETSVEYRGDHRFDADDEAYIGEFSFGETEIEGDEARVETRLTHIDDDASLEVSFETVLVRRDGEWLVDLDETTSRMVGSILGATMRELGDVLAEGMGEAMEELTEGLTEGIREMGEALGDAFEEGVRESRADADRARVEKGDSDL